MMMLHAGRLSGLLASALLSAAAVSACGSAQDDTFADGLNLDGGAPGSFDASSFDASSFDAGPLTGPFACEPFSHGGYVDYPLQFGFEEARELLGLDYLALRSEPYVAASDDAGVPISEDWGFGSACSGAVDQASCRAKLAALQPPTRASLFEKAGFGMIWYVVYTRGDDAGGVFDHAGLLALLGPIDAPAKAALVATQRGYSPQCERPWIRVDGDGFTLLTLLTLSNCPYRYADVLLHVAADGTVSELQRSERAPVMACAGRRPEGFALAAPTPTTGAYFAQVAQLEAASIDAFEILRDELAAHGAPRALIDDADRAARDEVRHARAMGKLATRFGAAAPPRPVVARGPVRSLEAMAIENAREGCVREAYAALEAGWQARYADDLHVQRTLAGIARDEVRHAELAWQVAAWLDLQLDASARARVDQARTEALDELAEEVAARHAVPAHTGLPSRTQARELLRTFGPVVTLLVA